MIRAKHNKAAQIIFRHYLKFLFHRHFSAFHLLDRMPETDAQLPLLLLPNHSTWWDGFFVFYFNQYFFTRRLYLMMLERQLRKYPFFKRVGAYGIEPDSPSAIRQSLRYSADVLNRQNSGKNMLCIFPQGELLPWHTRPLVFKKGIDIIIRQSEKPFTVLPLAMRVELLEEQRPEVFFLCGQPLVSDADSFPGSLFFTDQLTQLLQKTEQRIVNREAGKIIFSGKISIHHRFERSASS
jgi:hypothetical protein